ncbi:MAG: DNA methyltransferase [Acidimicrobiia bacterium]
MTIAKFHAEWLNLIEINGPFLTLPVLNEHFRSGLEPTDVDLVAELHTAQREVEDDPTLHPVWTRWVVSRLLGFPDEVLREGAAIGPGLTHRVAEHAETLRPDLVVVDQADDGSDRARLLITVWPVGTDLTERPEGERWAASPIDRIAELCRATTVRLGLVTNGDAWTLVDAPTDGATGTATWDATLWAEERVTLDAFTTLLGVRRFFTVPDNETLEALLAQSANAEAEVTDQLGKQVRAAVELLVDAMSRADRDRGGSVFRELAQAELEQDLEPYIYEAAVTVLMRLVFLLSAEERGLFLLGDPTYDATYAVSTLLAQLDEDANRYGEDVLDRRTDAWHRLLATFRMVHAGAAHANLRLPPYGGSLFDPDRFPFLEGRRPDQPRDEQAAPLRIDNRTIKHILDALQVLRFRGKGGWQEARRLSFRTLGVEQIGHVYEGLLDHGVVQVTSEAVALTGKNDPEVALQLIEDVAAKGHGALVTWLAELTGDKPKTIERALATGPDPDHLDRLASACDNDPELAARIAPYLGLLRADLRGLPQVYLPDSYYVTKSSDRRSSGAYYTPRSLAEDVVTHTLEPLVYNPGPAEGAEADAWKLKSSLELLDLRVCDMAMGSGAFLVSACRYLSERLLEAWDAEGLIRGAPIPLPNGSTTPMPDDEPDREVLARRLVADRCLYGVDRNPMAVEMAKLSLWLITLAKDRPFNFVDHALRCGDSLLGITDLDQLNTFHLDPAKGRALHGRTLFDPTGWIEPLVKAAVQKRQELESFTVIDIHDANRKHVLLDESTLVLNELKVIADLVVGAAVATSTQREDAYGARLLSVASDVSLALDPAQAVGDRQARLDDLGLRAAYWLDEGRPAMSPPRQCFHWVLEFPEVWLAGGRQGFDAIVGNPPFLGGTRIVSIHGDHISSYLARVFPPFSKRVDLCALFFRRAASLITTTGSIGLLATNTIAQATTRRGGLDILTAEGLAIARARKSFPWPGAASIQASAVWLTARPWSGTFRLDGREVASISSLLEPGHDDLAFPERLPANVGRSFNGSRVWGEKDGFYLTDMEAAQMLEADPSNRRVIKPCMNGSDLNNSPNLAPSRWIIDFGEMTEAEASGYRAPFERLYRTVRPWRLELDPKKYGRIVSGWWKYFHPRNELYGGIRDLNLHCVIARARVSDHHMLAFLPTDMVYMDKLVVFLLDDLVSFEVLQSGIHDVWARQYSSTLGTTMSYLPPDAFETFPLPRAEGNSGGEAASEFYATRSEVMAARGEGLTRTHNRVHSAAEMSEDIVQLRASLVGLDYAALASYGWSDIDLGHGFHETRQGVRYTFAEEARSEILERLLRLNVVRGEEQPGGRSRRARRPTTSKAPVSEESLF